MIYKMFFFLFAMVKGVLGTIDISNWEFVFKTWLECASATSSLEDPAFPYSQIFSIVKKNFLVLIFIIYIERYVDKIYH